MRRVRVTSSLTCSAPGDALRTFGRRRFVVIKVIIGFLGMLGLIFNATGIKMWLDVPSLSCVVGVMFFGLLASGKKLPNAIVLFKKNKQI